MKKITAILLLFPTLFFGLTGCANNVENEEHKYNDKFIYSEPVYEPLDIANENNDLFVISTDLLGVSKGVKAADWDNSDIKLRVKYNDYSIKDFDLKVINIPLDMRHYLGEVGKHSICFVEYKWIVNHEFEIIENENWHGYKCEFFDKDKKYLCTQTVGFYEEVIYNGPEIPSEEDDYDYHYRFNGWSHSTKYVHQDMQFLSKYEKKEKRFYANKPFNNDHIGLSALIDQDKNRGSSLIYLGRVRHVAAYYTETKELSIEDLEFSFKEDEFGKYFNEYNENIVKYSIEYIEDSDYTSKIYGNPYDMLNNPVFALEFDSRYEYKGVSAFLDDQSDVKLSSVNPYNGLFDEIIRKINSFPSRSVKKDEDNGFYRYAIVMSVDVYLSVSFNRLEKDTYEIGNFSKFIMSPVLETSQAMIQHSYNEEFVAEDNPKLALTTKGLYYAADMIDWGK